MTELFPNIKVTMENRHNKMTKSYAGDITLLKQTFANGYLTDAEYRDLCAKLEDDAKVSIITRVEGRLVELFKYKVCLLIDHALAVFFDENKYILEERMLEEPPE